MPCPGVAWFIFTGSAANFAGFWPSTGRKGSTLKLSITTRNSARRPLVSSSVALRPTRDSSGSRNLVNTPYGLFLTGSSMGS